MCTYEWAFFDRNGNMLPSVVTTEERTYAAGDVKNYNGKNYKIVHRIIDRVTTDRDLNIAVEV
ncbi:hypothetical protein PXW67_27425 [Klebsiella pneumoniae]|jgi:hypothetical protein|uniref:hypothetical protein n=1 Tax=Klebsiella pneumoniae complex TaxID=3390273 RepID=UPI0019C29794|nr:MULTISPECIES: hypothetical protein [Klebsiella]MBD7808770.1 hypothetical protein [Klebsiella pneumoniae]MCH9418655.1 hypothetical protein [Klebsiella quasipneumoniae]MDE4720600.1 hypothetical protein [Klebsiella pneumoniae]MDE4855000.1 hypothetical protein [Klebsiella pneumoniae]HCA0023738.1 hypothetical protein [Klebsiella pneumoniae]